MRSLIAVLTVAVGLSVPGQLSAQRGDGALAERIQDLNLTDDQEAKIADIRKECGPKIQEAAKELAAVVKEEVDKVRAVLTQEQKEKLQALKEERRERRAEGLAERIAHLRELDLTDAERAKIAEIRKEYRPKVAKFLGGLEGLLSAEQRKAREEALKAGKKRTEVIASLKLTDEQKGKVEAVGKEVATLVREELGKIRDVLTEEQQAQLGELKDERRDRIRDRMAARIANVKGLDLTSEQKSKIMDIRKEFRPKVHEAGNKLRAAIREEVRMILDVLKG
jgi:Spy/CpxP family protein refolding chaperone